MWVSYAAGAVFGGWAHDQWSVNALVVPLVILVVLVGVDLVNPIHGPGDPALASV